MTSPDAEPDPLSAASSISAFVDELITDAHKEYRAGKKANAKEPLRIQVKSSYRMEDRYVSTHVEDPEVRGNAEGIVKLDITLSGSGDVKSAKLNSASTITDEEVIEACKKAALKTGFNVNFDAPNLQRGTITYTFYRYEPNICQDIDNADYYPTCPENRHIFRTSRCYSVICLR